MQRLDATLLRAALTSSSNTPTPEQTPADGCWFCDGEGYIPTPVYVPQMSDWYYPRRPCPACGPARAAARRLALAKRLSEECGLSADQRSLAFDAFEPYEGNQAVLDRAVAFVERGIAERWWLGIQGESGNGKTMLLCCIANAAIAAGIPTVYAFVPELLEHLRAGYQRDEDGMGHPGASEGYGDFAERWERVRTADLLLLDDLGTQTNTAWVREHLLSLINYRHDYRLPLVYTTNYSLADLRDQWGGVAGERLYSRLLRYAPSYVVVNRAEPYHERKREERE